MNNLPHDQLQRINREVEIQIALQRARESDRVRDQRTRNKLLPAMNSLERRLLVVLAIVMVVVGLALLLFG
jgi:hypothetical protein